MKLQAADRWWHDLNPISGVTSISSTTAALISPTQGFCELLFIQFISRYALFFAAEFGPLVGLVSLLQSQSRVFGIMF